ncbi:immunoglobulin lambda-1 light chain-like [Archocentrus centrarchus]|uniref:immunoglobulin lambda-1 light chain-like n=1 Tax=Archocentrus centrarchus TaxID=63155 RepID=UPI0011E9DC92|nr:immunoglobulin lambda-1 light chain-like [Archocentrus centrarchus]
MLFLPAAALCCLCSALLTMAAQLIQKDKIFTRRVGDKVSFSCGGTGQCDESYIYWYQKKETQTFRVILDINKSNGDIDRSYSSHPQLNDFSSVNTKKGWELEIKQVKRHHSATYYCSCWVSAPHRYDYFIFGSGTKLSVTGKNKREPILYPAGPRVHVEGNSSLLCVPPAMFPSLVQLSCKRQKKNGGLEELPPAEGEQLQLIHEQENSTYKCSCYINDGGRTVEAQTQEELPAPAASCPPEREPADLPALQPADWSFQSQCRVKLLCLLSTVLIVKSLVYCCGLSLLMILRNKGASTNCTHAD